MIEGKLSGRSEYEQEHYRYLELLTNPSSLRSIGERPENIQVLFTESRWYPFSRRFTPPIPDMFIKYFNNDWTIVELKHSHTKRFHALEQIDSGINLLGDVFRARREHITGKFVVYRDNRFYTEVTHLNGLRVK